MRPRSLPILCGPQFDPFRLPNTAAAYDYDDHSSLIFNGSNQIILTGDKSGNSATNCLVTNAVAGNSASIPDSAPLSITSDIDLQWYGSPDNVAASGTMIGKAFASGQRSYVLGTSSSGTKINLTWSADGTTPISAVSTINHGVSSFTPKWFRATLDVDNGAGGNDANFYLSDDGENWTKIGLTVTTAGVTSIFDSTSAVTICESTAGILPALAAKTYRARIYNGIAGTLALDADFRRAAKGATTFTESSANAATVTINQSGDAGARICGERDIYQNTLGKCSVLSNVGGYWRAAQDGSNDFSKTGRFPLAQPLSIYWVGTMTTWTANDIILDGGANDTMEIFQDTTTPRLSAYAGGTVGPLTQFAVGQKHVFGLVLNGANSFAAVDLNPIVSGNAGTATPNGITLGSQATGSANSNIATNKLLIRSVADDAALFTRIMAKLVGRNAVS